MKTIWRVGLLGMAALGLCGCDEGRHDGDGYRTATVAVAVEPEIAVESLPAVAIEQTYDLVVRVQSNQGLPISGAWVQIAVDTGYGAEIQQVNADGWGQAVFRFWAQPGQWVFIDVVSTGFADEGVDLVVGGEPWMEVPVYLTPLVAVAL
ncbi:MAG: DUF1416 domain-containing protein [Spartobacteria bacterium]|nr:DUF1416 domain-containing protein [Spartobacteria bacterium]